MCSPTSNKMKFLSGSNSKFSQCNIFRVSVPLRVSVCACALINMRVTRAAHSERRRRRRRLWRQRNRRTVMPKSITLSKRTPTSVAVVAVAAGSAASASLTAFKCRQQTNWQMQLGSGVRMYVCVSAPPCLCVLISFSTHSALNEFCNCFYLPLCLTLLYANFLLVCGNRCAPYATLIWNWWWACGMWCSTTPPPRSCPSTLACAATLPSPAKISM